MTVPVLKVSPVTTVRSHRAQTSPVRMKESVRLTAHHTAAFAKTAFLDSTAKSHLARVNLVKTTGLVRSTTRRIFAIVYRDILEQNVR